MAIKQIIANAIQKADKSYFYEDYVEQAFKVLIELKKQGFAIVPLQANEEMIKIGVSSITYGNSKPEQLVERIYSAMVKNAKD